MLTRKICAILLALAVMCGITACGQKAETSENADTSTGDKTTEQTIVQVEGLPVIGVSFWDYLQGDTHKDDTPVSIIVGIDQSGYLREAHYESPEEIEYAVSRLADVIISAETDEDYTDNYNYLAVYWQDDTRTSVSLNLTNLEIFKSNTPHHYKLDNFDEFWKNSKSIAVDAEY